MLYNAAMGGKRIHHERDFKGVYIPKEIWLTPELTGYERLIFAEIHSLDREFGCIASNEHFAEWLGISERQVRDYIKRLKDKDLISVSLNKVKDTRTIKLIGRYKRISEEQIIGVGFLKKQLTDKWKM